MVVGCSIALGFGCNRQEASVDPTVLSDFDPGCNPADDCNEMFGGATIRQHSEQAGTFVELSSGCPHSPEDVPALETLPDASIPQFNRRRSRASNMHRGNDRLQDIDLHQHMMGMQPQIFACVDMAACYDDGTELGGDGELDFELELKPDGRVAAVSVDVSEGLDHPSVVACARRAIYDYRFPAYDGGQMMVSYSMTIEEVPGV